MIARAVLVAALSFLVLPGAALAADPPAARQIPAKTIPTPDTVSPELQALIAAPPPPTWNVKPKNVDEWHQLVAAGAARATAPLADARKRLGVTLEPTTIAGVKASILMPEKIAPENANRLLIHFHGGAYVLNPGEAGTREGMIMAAYGHAKVISVDYRLAPDNPYPAAIDDAIAVYKELIKTVPPRNIGVFGTSTGGGITMALMLRARQEGVPLPGAIAPGSPWVDITKTGDTYFTNELVDNFQVGYEGFLEGSAEIYANGHDMKDPMLSPVYGDLRGFPPTFITTGTRDLFLSLAARTHRKLRQAGVVAELQVFEGVSHAQYSLNPFVPETKECFEEIQRFFDRHLGK